MLGGAGTVASQSTTPPDLYTVEFGVDRTFEGFELNYWDDQFRDCPLSLTECTSGLATGGFARGYTSISEQLESRDAEALIGVHYRLEQMCDGQNTTLPFKAEFTFTYDVTSDFSVTGESRASINLRPQNPTDTPFVAAAVQQSGDSKSVTTPVKMAIDLTPDLNTTYLTTLGTRAEGSVQLTSDLTNDFATAEATATLSGVDIQFGDDVAPRSTPTLSPAEGISDTVTSGFKGWFNTPPTLTVSAYDPVVDADVNTIPHSCVEKVVLGDGLEDLGIGFFQRPNSTLLDQNRRYDLKISAVDHQGNPESPVHSISLGFDNESPITTVPVVPAQASGNNGWYKRVPGNNAAQVYFDVTCDDSNGHEVGDFSGCRYTNYTVSNGASGWRRPITTTMKYYAPEGSAVWLRADAVDKVYNQGPAATSTTIKVDLTAPGVIRNVSIPSLYNNDWWKDPVTMTFDCDAIRETLSGCAAIRTRLDNMGEFTSKREYNFTQEASHVVNTQSEDVAGNIGAPSFNARLDFTPPELVPNLRIDAPYNLEAGTLYTDQVPTWRWDAASDAPSGVRHYKLNLDGTDIGITFARSYKPSSLPDGLHTLTVTAVDMAGNEGDPISLDVFLDTKDPTATFTSPLAGTLYLYDGEVVDLAGDATVILTGYWINLTGTDLAPSSGFKDTTIYEVGATSRTPLGCTIRTVDSCRVEVPAVEGNRQGFGQRILDGEVRDRALNVGATRNTHLQADIAVVRQNAPGNSTVTGLVGWKGTQSSTFDHYEIHRSTTPYFTPVNEDGSLLGPKTLVATIDDQDTTSWVDTQTAPGGALGQFYYKVITTHGTNGVIQWISHETYIDYADATMEVSEPKTCSQTQFTCIS